MIAKSCPRETELLEALESARWPHATEASLREHVDGCSACRELAAVAGALLSDRRESEATARVPSSGATWWRMQLRLARESQVKAERTAESAYSAVVGLTVVALAVILVFSSLFRDVWMTMGRVMDDGGLARALPLSTPSATTILAIAIPLLLFAPVALYLALARE